MQKKASKPQSFSILMHHYAQANLNVFGARRYVHNKYIGSFLTLEDDLRELGADPRYYAYTVVKMLKSWARDKRLNYIPVQTFCGKWAFDKFLKVWKSETVEIAGDDDHEMMLYNELLVARQYVALRLQGSLILFMDVVEQCRTSLSEGWLHVYDHHTWERRPIDDVVDLICDEYNIDMASSYDSIIARVKAKRQWRQKRHTPSIAVSD